MKTGYWETHYICSICGEHSRSKEERCPCCDNKMRNAENILHDGWRDARKDPPELLEDVIVYITDCGVWMGYRVSKTKYSLVGSPVPCDTVTHWMQCPQEP